MLCKKKQKPLRFETLLAVARKITKSGCLLVKSFLGIYNHIRKKSKKQLSVFFFTILIFHTHFLFLNLY